MLLEHRLASLPAADAERFVRALFAPDQRFARVYHKYYRNLLGHDETTAKLETLIELRRAADHLLENLTDPQIHTVGFQKVAVSWQDAGDLAAYQPIGIFGYRPLTAHPFGARIAEVIARGPLAPRCVAPAGIAHCVGILDAHASLEILKTIFISIAHKARIAGHDQLFFFTPDHRLEGLFRRFGMEFPPELAVPQAKHLIGMFDLAANRARVDAIESQLATGRDVFSRGA